MDSPGFVDFGDVFPIFIQPLYQQIETPQQTLDFWLNLTENCTIARVLGSISVSVRFAQFWEAAQPTLERTMPNQYGFIEILLHCTKPFITQGGAFKWGNTYCLIGCCDPEQAKDATY
jgi:hypothetical protein